MGLLWSKPKPKTLSFIYLPTSRDLSEDVKAQIEKICGGAIVYPGGEGFWVRCDVAKVTILLPPLMSARWQNLCEIRGRHQHTGPKFPPNTVCLLCEDRERLFRRTNQQEDIPSFIVHHHLSDEEFRPILNILRSAQ